MDFDLAGSEAQAAKKLHVAIPEEHVVAIRFTELMWIVLAFFLFAIYLDATDVSDKVIAERRAQIEGCIAQYAAGERYARSKPLKCAPMVEAPNYIMTHPLGGKNGL